MKARNRSVIALIVVAGVCLGLGAGLGWWLAWQHSFASGSTESAMPTTPPEKPAKILYWYDPMQPQQHFDRPGKSPFMDMELVPKYADSAGAAMPKKPGAILYWYDPMQPQQHFDHPGKSPFMESMELVPKYADDGAADQAAPGITIDPEVSESIGLRLATVARTALNRQIEASSLIAFNDRDVAIVQARSGGFVERVWPLAAGDVVKTGQPLAELLLPEWAAAQREFLAVRGADATLRDAARERLRLMGMPESLITKLERTGTAQTRYTVAAPIAGVIQSLDVRGGMTVTGGQSLARINGLAKVWLDIAVPEAEADMARVGNRAEVRLSALPDTVIAGRVAQILPALNENSRSLRVRIELDNPDRQLRPGQSAQVTLKSEQAKTVLTVPTEALIRTGKRTVVMLAGAQGRFSPVEVVLGHEIGAQTQIVEGLEEGQQVVASGQFLLDSEASLNGVAIRTAPAGHQHGGEVAP